MNTYKLIIGQKACPICQGIGITSNPVKICDCAGILDVGIPDALCKLITDPEHNPEQFQHIAPLGLHGPESSDPETSSISNEPGQTS
jgi:hypothetical protein